MVVIRLNEEYEGLVVSGEKVSTVRRGRRGYKVGWGVLKVGERRIGIEIERVRYKEMGELTEAEAVRDGMRDLEELISVLRRIYPGIELSEEVTIVDFQVRRDLDGE